MNTKLITILLITAFIVGIIAFFVLIYSSVNVNLLIREQNDINFQIINDVFLQGQVGYYSKFQDNWLLINCLIWHESKGNPKARGQAGEIGILQFMPGTFQAFCVKRYGYRDDIYNSLIQKDCAAEMIENGKINHWTTKKFCVQ